MAWEAAFFVSWRRLLNVWGAVLSVVMVLSGCLMCSESLRLSEARTFVIGVYFGGFGLFSLVLEWRRFESVLKWLPFLDTFVGKGVFFVFWGFLLFDGGLPWQIVAGVYVASGLFYLAAHFNAEGPLHFQGDDKFQDTRAKDAISRYENDSSLGDDDDDDRRAAMTTFQTTNKNNDDGV